MSLSLVYRAARPLLLASAALRVSLAAPQARHASLSAIHRGLARSEMARPQGARFARASGTSDDGQRMTYAERQKARAQLAAERPTYKIRKGKKDITDHPDEAKSPSRRARFYDPDSSFGKKSLVYQMKTGKFRDELAAMDAKDTSRSSDSPFQRTGPRRDLRPPTRRAERRATRGRGSRRDKETMDAEDVIAELSRPEGSSGEVRPSRDARGPPLRERETGRGSFGRDSPKYGDAPRRDFASRDRDAAPRDFARRDRDTPRRDFAPRDSEVPRRDFTLRDRDAPRRDFAPRDRDDRRRDRDAPRKDEESYKSRIDREPLSIPYTTAASQFLYGKSVVEAALRSSRRQMYKLYVYGGANRQTDSNDDALIKALARKRGVRTEVVDEDGLRLLDKLSGDRPHNGFVLEASPLPQAPLAALGPLADDYASKPGYPITLGHQSAEEAAINGTPSFIPSPSATHKPLVVILDRILDPGNLGAILRTVSFLGATAVGVTRKGSATLTPVALKASAGAAESLTLFSIASLPEFLNASRDNGWAVYAAVAGEETAATTRQRRCVSLRDVEDTNPLLRQPCVLLVGNEGEGLDRLTVKKADYEVNIPNLSPPGTGVDSLNVSVAAGLLCSAFLRGMAKEREGLLSVGDGGEGGEELETPMW